MKTVIEVALKNGTVHYMRQNKEPLDIGTSLYASIEVENNRFLLIEDEPNEETVLFQVDEIVSIKYSYDE